MFVCRMWSLERKVQFIPLVREESSASLLTVGCRNCCSTLGSWNLIPCWKKLSAWLFLLVESSKSGILSWGRWSPWVMITWHEALTWKHKDGLVKLIFLLPVWLAPLLHRAAIQCCCLIVQDQGKDCFLKHGWRSRSFGESCASLQHWRCP